MPSMGKRLDIYQFLIYAIANNDTLHSNIYTSGENFTLSTPFTKPVSKLNCFGKRFANVNKGIETLI